MIEWFESIFSDFELLKVNWKVWEGAVQAESGGFRPDPAFILAKYIFGCVQADTSFKASSHAVLIQNY